MRHWTFLAACAALCVVSASEKPRVWQEGTVVYAERQKEAPAPSDAVAVTDSENPIRTAMNRGLEKLIGLRESFKRDRDLLEAVIRRVEWQLRGRS